MVKLDIAKRITGQMGITESEAVTLLDEILDLFKATLQGGEPIVITNFGKFSVRSKAPRRGRNPRTGEEVMISPRRVVIFHASDHFKAEVDSVQAEKQDTEGLLTKGKEPMTAGYTCERNLES